MIPQLRWHFDPAASGPRHRMWFKGWEMVVYLNNAHWSVFSPAAYQAQRQGLSTSVWRAKLAACWAAFVIAWFVPGERPDP